MIYTITTLTNDGEDSRCVGYFATFERAEEALAENECDINEADTYPLAVIERVQEGLYPATEELWYKWNGLLGRYVPCDKPDQFKNFCNFGIG